MIKRRNKIIYILLLIIYLINSFSGIVSAVQIDSAQILDFGECERHLQFWDTKQNAWSDLITHYVGYNYQGKTHPAYCLDGNKHGVGDEAPYTVDISTLLDRVDVWRTITAGFPYKTASQMGCSTDEDAFVATKQAVYSVLYGYNPETRYHGKDTRGEQIKNAIINLVNEGRNGSRTPQSANVTINRQGDLVKNGDYCYQEMSVSSFVNMGEYTITATNGLPEGSKIVDMNNQEKGTFSGNEHFKIAIPTDKVKNDINVTISARAKCETYPIFYGVAPNSSWQDYALTFDPMADEQGITEFTINTHKSTIKIIKQDAEFNYYKVPGVVFNFRYEDGENIGNYTTDQNGEITVERLRPGTIIAKEIQTNENYILNANEQKINLGFVDQKVQTINNERKRGNLKVYKVDKDNHKVTLGNVEFDLYSHEQKKVIGTYRTNVNGEIYIENLRVADYSLIEKETNKWYNLAENTQVKVEWNKTKDVVVENELKKGQVKVIKVDKDNNETKIEGVEFEVLDENNKVLEKIVTNKDGEALTSKYPVRDFEKLKLRESKTLENYVLSDEEKTITLKENQIENITFENEKKKGQIKVIKVDLDNNEIRIPNVEFNVYDEKGNVVDTLVTDANGEATSKRLPIDQQYKVQETKTGEWYVLNNEPQTAILEQDKITEMTFTNEKKKGQIKVIKVDLDNNEVLLEGVTFDILDENKNVVDTIVTNENGEATTKRLPIDQEYTAVERATRKEYVLTEETKKVQLKQDEITSVTFENEKIKGYVEITKVDSKTKETLKDAKFGIYNENDELVGTLITDENGKAKSELLPYGKYYLKELETGSVYYLLNENTYEFEIVKNHETIPLTIENDGVDIKVTVDKEGTSEIKPGEKVDYVFSNVGNASNVYLENFKWVDYIPTDYIRLETMTTGTWNQDLTYSVYYKTNKSEDYILFKENLSTQENYNLDFTTLELGEDEYITETMYDFGKVDVGFKESISPTMQCKSLDTLQDGETFTNHTKTIGMYYGVTAESDSDWTTVVHIPEEKHETVLPKTGK